VAKAFTPRRVELLRPRAQQLVDQALDTLIAVGPPADLVQALALPLPIVMICEMLGTRVEDRERFQQWSTALVSSTAFAEQELEDALRNITGYLEELIAERRRRHHDDLLADLVAARDAGDALTEDELVSFGVTLLVAGYETTANQIANFVYLLVTHPGELARLRTDPGLVPSAVEELLRFSQLGGGVGRTRIATEDVPLSCGTVHAGEAVFVAGGVANLDRSVFADPHRLDVGRTDNPHLSFGFGPHFCLGAQLARMELQVAISSLVTRLPRLRLAIPAEAVEWKKGLLMRGPTALPIEW
jgi:nocardicin N-oxygenase